MAAVRFSYQPLTAGAHEVGIAGDFTDWEILDLVGVGGVYVLSLPVETGRHLYKLIVDGNWMPDPANPALEPDPFGGLNSVLVIASEETPHHTWEEVFADLGLLQERVERYLWINRRDTHEYELRFDWYPDLRGSVFALIGTEETPLVRLGAHANRDVCHCLFSSAADSVPILIRLEAEGRGLFYGGNGFQTDPAAARPLNVRLSELPVFRVPDWIRRGVIYQIFPDRFCNGDPGLDPDFSEWYYDDCRTPPPPGELLPPQREYYHLADDWYDCGGLRQTPFLEPGKPDWWSFYGGDIPGLASRLDYLSGLGVTVIYFNPLWQAKSNHKYDAADFRRVDPHFGSTAQLKDLVKLLHGRGIRVILDVAFNHTGETFWAFRDCVEKGEASPYWNWYDWRQWPLPKPLPPDFDPREYYQCWWGIKDMPDLNYDLSRSHPAENYVRDIRKAIPNAALVDYLLESVAWWLQDIGIDGFRLDVPDEVPYWFWQLFRAHVKSLKPDAYIVGEIWNNAQGWVNHRYFDAVMNYAFFKNPVLDYFLHGLMDRDAFQARIGEGLAAYPLQALQAMMNLLGSHDTWRVAELVDGDLARLRLALFFQFTFVGVPHIYYGDEIAMRGGMDPDNRRPFDWRWESDPAAVAHRDFYWELIRLRASSDVFVEGEFAFLETDGDLLAYKRWNAARTVVCLINPGSTPCSYPFSNLKSILFRSEGVSPVGRQLILPPQSVAAIE
jgi:glycosidase